MSDREFSSATAEHYSPAWLVEIARDVMGEIWLDPCSCAKAQETVRAQWYMTEAYNGLARSWADTWGDDPRPTDVYVNPPGGRNGKLVKSFWDKLWSEIDDGNVRQFTWLCFNISQLRTLRPHIDRCHVCVLNKRIPFTGPSPTRDNAVLYWGPFTDRFIALMQPHGVVWQPVAP